MTQNYDIETCEGTLALDNSSDSNFEVKQDMLSTELAKINMKHVSSTPNRIIQNVLDKLEDDPQDSHSKTCHKDRFVKAGGAGWRSSYSRKC